MYNLIQEAVREHIGNLLTFVLSALMLGYIVFNGIKSLDAFLAENEKRHKRSSELMHDAYQKIHQLELDLDEIDDDISDLYRHQNSDDDDHSSTSTETDAEKEQIIL